MNAMRVILADDSSLILERLNEMVSTHKQVETVGLFKNGIEALEGLRMLKPDLAIVDIKMPGLSGLEVLNEIRKENKTIKFIILTFYSSEYHRQMALKAGADYFFNKVDDFEKVSTLMDELLLKEEYNRRLCNWQ
jgi:DNA-binding NarL/FixJ family response regulator